MSSRVHRFTLQSFMLGGVISVLSACGETGPSAPVAPSSVSNVTGVTLSGTAGQLLTDQVVVRIADAASNPLDGVTVTFAAAGGGTVNPASATTDDRGEARTRWTLGPTAGAQTLTATVDGGASVQITATANAGRAAAIAVSAGNNQTATAGSAVATNPAVVVRDANNNPVVGAAVVFTPIVGGGQVTDAVRLTNAQGVATVGQWTLGSSAGAQTLSAQVTEAGVTGNPVIFTATATAGTAATLVAVSPTSQSAGAGTLVASPPSVRVNDANGNPVAGVSVNFVVTAGVGTLTGSTQTSNAQGIATVGSWQLGAAIGTNSVSATAAGVAPVSFTATGTAGPPASLQIVAGDGQSVPINRPTPIAPRVAVRDAGGNGVAGVAVTFTVGSGGGIAVSGNQVTDANGNASVGAWFVGGTPGVNTLIAASGGLAPVTFTATATAGPAVSMQAVSLISQGGTAGANVASPPSVIVRDALGNPAAGVEVTFSVTGGAGSVAGAVDTTGFDGLATVLSWTLGNTPGINTVVASSPGLPTVTFTASSVGPASQVISFAGQGQAAVQGTAVATRPAVRVMDAGGNGVPGVGVVFAVTAGGGSVTGATQTTDVNGIATVSSWTLGAGATQTLSATVSGSGVVGNPVTFTASAATQITVTTIPVGSVPSGTAFSVNVQLRDAAGAVSQVSGVPLTIAIQTGAGVLSGTTIVNTNASGQATFNITITGAAGNRTFIISGTGVGSVVTATITIS